MDHQTPVSRIEDPTTRRPGRRLTGRWGGRPAGGGASLLIAALWMVVSLPVPLAAQETTAGKDASAKPRSAATNPAASPTSDTVVRSADSGAQMFQLGNFGGKWANIYLGQLRGELGRAIFTTKKREISQITMVGLIRIESEDFTLECENLKLLPNKSLDARYNVHVFLAREDLKADCGQLVYDMEKNTITLTVDPHIYRKTEEGELETSNLRSVTITLKPDGDYDMAIDGANVYIGVRQSSDTGAPPIKSTDRPTTPAAPREIIPGSLPPGPSLLTTPTPNPTRK